MHYIPGDGFDMKELTDEQYFEARSLHRYSAAYALLGLIAIGFGIFFAIKGRFGFAILIWLIGQVSSFYGGVLHRRAHEVYDE